MMYIRTWKGSEGNSGKPASIKIKHTKAPKTNNKTHNTKCTFSNTSARSGLACREIPGTNVCPALLIQLRGAEQGHRQDEAKGHGPLHNRQRICRALSSRMWWIAKSLCRFIGWLGKFTKKSTKNCCRNRHLIQLMDFLNWLEEASLHTYLVLSSPQASTSGYDWAGWYWARWITCLSQCCHSCIPVTIEDNG